MYMVATNDTKSSKSSKCVNCHICRDTAVPCNPFSLAFLPSADPSSTIYGLYSHVHTNKVQEKQTSMLEASFTKASILLKTTYKLRNTSPQIQENTFNHVLIKAAWANMLTDIFLGYVWYSAMHQKKTYCYYLILLLTNWWNAWY